MINSLFPYGKFLLPAFILVFAQYIAWRWLALSSWRHAIKVLRDKKEEKEKEKP